MMSTTWNEKVIELARRYLQNATKLCDEKGTTLDSKRYFWESTYDRLSGLHECYITMNGYDATWEMLVTYAHMALDKVLKL